MVDLIELPIDPMEVAEDVPFLAQYFPNMFAQALVPFNPHRWPAFIAGSAMANDMPEFGDKIQTLFNNLIVAKEYLETSLCDVQYRDRIWQVTKDTFSINGSCEIGKNLGSFGAGAAANKMADRYMNEMAETSFTLTKSEKLNQRIYEQFAKSTGSDPSLVRGTGLARQFVPKASRGNIFDRPARGSRPLWAYKHMKSGRGPFGFVTPLIFNKRSTLQLAKLLLDNKKYSIVKQIVALYSYFRYVKFVHKVARKFIPIIPKIYKNLWNRAIIIRQKLNRKNIRRFILISRF